MAREALIELSFIKDIDIENVINQLCNEGWTIKNNKGKVEYLPIGDKGDFEWQEADISCEEWQDIIVRKQESSELIGVNLFFEGTSIGISLLGIKSQDIIISLDINRKTIDSERNSLTDFTWYFETIINALQKDKLFEFSYKFEDYIG